MALGYVYVLSNPSISSGLKVVFTTRNVEGRAKELSSSTGVPQPFVIEYWRITDSVEKIERLVHQDLEKVRLNHNREFFDISIDSAIEIIRDRCISIEIEYERDRSEPEVLLCRRCGYQWFKSDSRLCTNCWG